EPEISPVSTLVLDCTHVNNSLSVTVLAGTKICAPAMATIFPHQSFPHTPEPPSLTSNVERTRVRRSGSTMSANRRFVIIGGGLAGAKTAEALRERDFDGDIV